MWINPAPNLILDRQNKHPYKQSNPLKMIIYNKKINLDIFPINNNNQKHKLQYKMSLSSSTVGGKIKYKVVLLGNQHVGKTSII